MAAEHVHEGDAENGTKRSHSNDGGRVAEPRARRTRATCPPGRPNPQDRRIRNDWKDVPRNVPKPGPRTILRQQTPPEKPIKNGPEIINFRPVLSSRATLANRRLQPLGHLIRMIFLTSRSHIRPVVVLLSRWGCRRGAVSGNGARRAGEVDERVRNGRTPMANARRKYVNAPGQPS